MEQVVVDGITLVVEAAGTGEPVVFIHGALIADAFQPLLSEAVLTDSYRLITYRRRGYEGSSPVPEALSIREQASDCLLLIKQLGVSAAHIVGHSFGGVVALQLAMDAPDWVHSLVLLEPALMIGSSGPAYRNSLEVGIRQYRSQDAGKVVSAMLGARWPGYEDGLERVMPGAVSQAVRYSAASFESELPALLNWSFGEAEAREITQPVLSVLGEMSGNLSPRFGEVHRWLLSSLRHAEGYILSGAHHFLQIENPRETAFTLTSFFARHPVVVK